MGTDVAHRLTNREESVILRVPALQTQKSGSLRQERTFPKYPGNSRDLNVVAEEKAGKRTQCKNTILLAAPYQIHEFLFFPAFIPGYRE